MKNTVIRKALVMGAAALVAGVAYAVPAKPGLRQAVQPDGSVITYRLVGDEHFHYYMTADSVLITPDDNGVFHYADRNLRSTGVVATSATRNLPAQAARVAELAPRPAMKRAKSRVPENMLTTTFPSSGTPRALVVLVQFTDKKFSMSDPKTHFEDRLNKYGFSENGAEGCATEFFETCSMGQFVPQFDVYGPLTLKNRYSYYGKNDRNGEDMYPYEMAIEACEQLDDEIDFKIYDTDGDGYIDNVYVFYAGKGEANSNDDNTVWPHSWDMIEAGVEPMFDGVQLNHYACSNELYPESYYSSKTLYEGIGTFCHEFSHVLGLPDLYDYNDSAYTPGAWSLLDKGSYNGDGHVPPLYTAFERLCMGWMQPKQLTGPDDITIRPIVENDAYLIQTEKDNEFFLLENRQQEGFDKELPGHGMLVWHIDYDEDAWAQNDVNSNRSHQRVDIEEADGYRSTTKHTEEYLHLCAAETFPGRDNHTEFTDTSAPNMKSWSGKSQNLGLTEIAETSDGLVTMKVAGGKSAGIADVATDSRGYTMNGRRVLAAAGGEVSVFSTAGALIGSGRSVEIPTTGVYIIAAGDTRGKEIVK